MAKGKREITNKIIKPKKKIYKGYEKRTREK